MRSALLLAALCILLAFGTNNMSNLFRKLKDKSRDALNNSGTSATEQPPSYPAPAQVPMMSSPNAGSGKLNVG